MGGATAMIGDQQCSEREDQGEEVIVQNINGIGGDIEQHHGRTGDHLQGRGR